MPLGDSIGVEYGGTGATTPEGARESLSVRQEVTTHFNLFVSKTGSDSNDGLSQEKAFATIEKAIYVATSLDYKDDSASTIVVGDGDWPEVYLRPHNCKSALTITSYTSDTFIVGDWEASIVGRDCGAWIINALNFKEQPGKQCYAVSAIGASKLSIFYNNKAWKCSKGVFHATAGGKIEVDSEPYIYDYTEAECFAKADGAGSEITFRVGGYSFALYTSWFGCSDAVLVAESGGVINAAKFSSSSNNSVGGKKARASLGGVITHELVGNYQLPGDANVEFDWTSIVGKDTRKLPDNSGPARPVFESSVNLFVSPTGRDTNDGTTLPKAFRSIQAAIERATDFDFVKGANVLIQVESGNYEPFTLKNHNGYWPICIYGSLTGGTSRIEVPSGQNGCQGDNAGDWWLTSLHFDHVGSGGGYSVDAVGNTSVKLYSTLSAGGKPTAIGHANKGATITVEGSIDLTQVTETYALFVAEASSLIDFLPSSSVAVGNSANMQILLASYVVNNGSGIQLNNTRHTGYAGHTCAKYNMKGGSYLMSFSESLIPGLTDKSVMDITCIVNSESTKVREIPRGNAFYVYVNQGTGSDSNGGLSASDPVKTIDAALSKIKRMDLQEHTTVSIRLASGSYGRLVIPDNFPWKVEIWGASLTNTYFTHNSALPLVDCGKNNNIIFTAVHLKGLSDPNGNPMQYAGVLARAGSYVNVNGCAFTGSRSQMLAEAGGHIEITGTNYLYPQSTIAHMHARTGGRITTRSSSPRSMGSSLYQVAFALAETGGIIENRSTSWPAQQGRRYFARSGGIIYAANGTGNTFPGNVAGVVESGGIFNTDPMFTEYT